MGNAAPASKLNVTGEGNSSTTQSFIIEKLDGTDILETRDDGKVSIANDGFNEALNVNGQGRFDAIDLRQWAGGVNTNEGEIEVFLSETEFPDISMGSGGRRYGFTPKDVQLQAVDYNTSWTTGRTKAFWTVPARYTGWKIYSATLMVSTIGTGTNTVEVEKGGTALSTTNITSATHKVVLDAAIATDDIITFDITAVSGTPTKGLFVELVLYKN
jgi:hypothetical protein